MISMALVLVCASATLGCCVLLIFHKEYDDGFIGRLGLSIMGMIAASRLLHIAEHLLGPANGSAETTPYSVLLWIGLGLFLVRHTWRFVRRARTRPESWYATEDKSKHGAFKLVSGARR